MEHSLRVATFEELPSAEEFASRIEPKNVPSVFRGCIKDWKAFSSWNTRCGGLDYLQEKAGSSVVEAMLSKSAPVFYGDIRNHERVPVPFSSFIALCKQHLQSQVNRHAVCDESESPRVACSAAELHRSLADIAEHIYLAQVPILTKENEERIQLGILRDDIKIPCLLEAKELASINLWMNKAQSRSSTHYDPHNNLLCIVAGRKQVMLWPPSKSTLLYPMPIYGEASNHSSVSLDDPDFSIHPRAEHLSGCSQKVVLQEGDALFIPEGWFHQVDSDDLTIAVNFWWRSTVMASISEHMDAYYLRRLLRRFIDKEMNQMLPANPLTGSEKVGNPLHELSKDEKADDKKDPNMLKKNIGLHDLNPKALQALRELVSLVHDGVSVTNEGNDESTSGSDSRVNLDEEQRKMTVASLCHLEDDPVAKILWNLEPFTLPSVFLAMVHNFPRTLEALVLHMLSPVGAEVLTRKFDKMDQQMTEEERSNFYQVFYSVFDDQFSAMEAILNGKESFAWQAFKNVLQLYVGVNFDGQKQQIQLRH